MGLGGCGSALSRLPVVFATLGLVLARIQAAANVRLLQEQGLLGVLLLGLVVRYSAWPAAPASTPPRAAIASLAKSRRFIPC